MKQGLTVLLMGVCVSGLLAGCGTKLDVNTNTIKLDKKGKVLEASVEDFSESYYDEEELSSFITETVENYTSENGEDSVKICKSEVDEGTAYLTLQYDSLATFSDFNEIECFSGDILEAQSAGYDFETEFYDVSSPVENGSSEGETLYDTVSAETVLAEDDLKVLIIRDNIDIIIPGTVVYVSTEQVDDVDKDTVHVLPKENDTDESALVYVLYK